MKIPDYKDANILVVGDVMLDRYWQGQTQRISPESPVPVVNVQGREDKPGGAGNVAVNVAALEGQVNLIGAIGCDEAGACLKSVLTEQGIKTNLTEHDSMPTITKLRVLSRHQQMIRLDFEQPVPESIQPTLLRDYEACIKHSDVIILSDYAKGTIQHPQTYIELAKKANKPVLVDPKGNDFAKYQGATLLTPNRKEFEQVMGVCNSEEALETQAQLAIETYDLQAILVTRSEEGMTLYQKDKAPYHLPAYTKEVFDVTGAGDTVIALIASSLSVGQSLEHAVYIANIAASIVVTKLGASTVTTHELRSEMNRIQGLSMGVVDTEVLTTLIEDCKAQGERIVMTNGCFDILHIGHIQYLKKAKALGDRLLVAVNTDDSVKQLKGPKRPINGLQERMAVLAELGCVDWVVPFSELTPIHLIQTVNPDILVKGGDYKVNEVVGGDHVIEHGGRVEIIDYVSGFSTTELIKTINEDTAA